MRNRDDAAIAFIYRIPQTTRGSVHTDGHTIYSYGEHFPMAFWSGEELWVNESTYSRTTSQHQGALKRSLENRRFTPTDVTAVIEHGRANPYTYRLWADEEREG